MNKYFFILLAMCLPFSGLSQQWLGSSTSSGTVYRGDKIKVGYGPLYLDWTYQNNWNGNAQMWAGYIGFNAFRYNNETKDMYHGENPYTSKLVFEGSMAGFRWLHRAPSGNDSDGFHPLNELMVLSPIGADVRLGLGTPSPDFNLQVHSSNNPTIAIGKGNQNTAGKSSILFNAGDGTAANGFWINYFKTTSADRLAFVDGGATERMSISNGGNVKISGTPGGSALTIVANPAANSGAHFVSEDGGNNVTFRLNITANGATNTELKTAGNSYLNAVYGNVGIGTTTPGNFKLAVNGKIWGTEVQVALTNPGPDYVFEEDYKLLSLESIKAYIDKNKHLPEVPSAKEMEANGVNLGEMNMLLLKKIEELTLHLIELKKENEEQNILINKLVTKK